MMNTFVEREVLRCAYVEERRKVRSEEAAVLEAKAAEGGGGGGDEAAPAVGGDGDGDGAGKVKKVEEEVILSVDELAEVQQSYSQTEARFIEELALQPTDLPESWQRANGHVEGA